MLKKLSLTGIMMGIVSASYAGSGQPLTLSGPFPAVSSSYFAGDRATSFTYTITNNTNTNIPATQTVTGNSTSIEVTSPCAVVPAGGACNFNVTFLPLARDYLLSGGVQNTVTVNYSGRLPANLTSTINTSVDIPPLGAITISPSTANSLAGGYTTFTARGTSTSGTTLDVTPVVTWTSSDSTRAAAPNTSGQAITYLSKSANSAQAGGPVNIGASFRGVSATNATLGVYNYLYVAAPYNGTNNPTICTGFTASAPGGSIVCSNATEDQVATYQAINAQGTYIYFPQTSSMNTCTINFTTGNYTNCTGTFVSGTSTGLTINKISPNDQTMYVVSPGEGLYACSIIQTSGLLGGCALQAAVISPTTIGSFALDPSGNYIYIWQNTGVVDVPFAQTCAVDTTTGTLSNCTGQTNAIPYIWDVTAVATPQGTYLYGTNVFEQGPVGITVWPVSSTGTIGTFVQPTTNVTFNSPQGISVISTSTGALSVYVGDGQDGSVNVCPIITTGADAYQSFGTCTSTNLGKNLYGTLVR